ncbi:MAG TPA: hypothetical protein VF331_28695 [Polyangiales bacterium]
MPNDQRTKAVLSLHARLGIGLVWLLLLLLQTAATYAARDRFGYEELAESVRNPFWLEQRTIYDGVSSNIGWYGLCLVLYKLFGFSLALCKWMRLGLQAISLGCVLSLLRRALPSPSHLLPAFAIALSPTLLYFNTYQASYGSDLQLAPIALLCVLSIDPSRPLHSTLLHAGFGALAALACMSYPAFVFYLPFAAVLFAWLHWTSWRAGRVARAAGAPVWREVMQRLLSAVAAPLTMVAVVAASALCLRDPKRLFHDERTGAGLFRGGGGPIDFDLGAIALGVQRTLSDLLISGRSYYFNLSSVELGGWLGGLACILPLGAALWLLARRPASSRWLAVAIVMMVFGLVVPNLASALPGLRRCTLFVFSFYLFVTLLMKELQTQAVGGRRTTVVSAVPVAVLLLHHLLAYPAVIEDLQRESASRPADWWLQAAPTPALALQHWVAKAEAGELIRCPAGAAQGAEECRYGELFAAVAGYQLWTLGHEPKVVIANPHTGAPLSLSVALWESYYFEH